MYICKYCGRQLKEHYETCPGCGGVNFEEKAFLGETIIKTPPKGGYKLNLDNYNIHIKKIRKTSRIVNLATILLFIIIPFPIILISILTVSSGDITDSVPYILLFTDMLIVSFIIGISLIIRYTSIKKIKKDIEKLNKLKDYGMLVKGLKYEIKDDGSFIGNKKLHYYIEVNYKNANGSKIPLTSEFKYDTNEKKYETVDLLIDQDDYSNYFIDYEIY